MVKLKGKVAIVTGGGRGIGRQMALAYAEEGAAITLAARTAAEVEAVAGEIKALGGRALAVPTDVSVEAQVDNLVESTMSEFGRIDVMLANAGGTLGSRKRPVWELSLGQWQLVLDINLTGTFLCARAVAPIMIKQQCGSIITLSSGMGRAGKAGFGAYSAAKFGIEGLTQALAADLAPFGIRVNALQPGGVVAVRTILKEKDVDTKICIRDDIVRPLAVFLAGDDSAGVTGQSLSCAEWNAGHGFGDRSQYLYSP